MSNGRPFRKVRRLLDDLFGQTENQPIPGGCESCSAFQTLAEVDRGVYSLIVHHDDWCPVIQAKQAKAT
jgi:hypothetical protein